MMARHITILGMGGSAHTRKHDIERYIPPQSEVWGLNNGYMTFQEAIRNGRFSRFFELHAWEYLSTYSPGTVEETGEKVDHFGSLHRIGCEIMTGQRLPVIQNQTQLDWEEIFGFHGTPVYFLGSPSIMLALALYEHQHGQEVGQVDSWGIDTADPRHVQQRSSWAYWVGRCIERGIQFGGTALDFMREKDNDDGLTGIRQQIETRLAGRRIEGPVVDYAVASFCTDDDFYRPKMERLKAQAEGFGLDFVGTVIPVPEGKTARQTARAFPATIIRSLLKEAGKPILYIDADDELLVRPSFPACDVGVMRNPELSCRETHLQWAPFMFIAPGPAANKFLSVREESMATVCGHRGTCIAYTMLHYPKHNRGKFLDVSKYVRGCIQLNPSPSGFRPQTLHT